MILNISDFTEYTGIYLLFFLFKKKTCLEEVSIIKKIGAHFCRKSFFVTHPFTKIMKIHIFLINVKN